MYKNYFCEIVRPRFRWTTCHARGVLKLPVLFSGAATGAERLH